jgi:hypothetical protein
MRTPLALLALLAATSPLAAQGTAPFTVRESGQGFANLQDAVNAIGDKKGTILIAPGRYKQCAVQQAGDIAYIAQQPGSATFERIACEGKASLVLRGRNARVEGLIFDDIKVPDANGAGIRLEKGNLSVAESMFRDSEGGILSANDPTGTIRVERSTFSGLGRCDRDLACAHSIYIGDYGNLIVDKVRFERGRGGHYVKTRAARIQVTDSSFDDTAGQTTNYMIDLSAGATGRITNNVFVQGKNKENHSAMIVIAAEGRTNSSDGLVIEGNDASLAPGMDYPTSFVADLGGDDLRIGANRLGRKVTRFERR